MGRIENWIVAEEGLTLSAVRDEANSDPAFAKTKTAKVDRSDWFDCSRGVPPDRDTLRLVPP